MGRNNESPHLHNAEEGRWEAEERKSEQVLINWEDNSPLTFDECRKLWYQGDRRRNKREVGFLVESPHAKIEWIQWEVLQDFCPHEKKGLFFTQVLFKSFEPFL